MEKFKYISMISIDEVNEKAVIPCINEQGYHCILIKNKLQKTVASAFATDNLSVQLNSLLYFDNREFYFHILTATKNDIYSIEQFNVIYEYIFKKIEKPVADTELTILIASLEDYFKTTPESNLIQFQAGVFGELLTIKHLYDLGYTDIIYKYHENFYSKHDVEISNKLRIEIKSTMSEKRIHTFKHNQIYRNDIDVLVVSVMLEKSQEGMSLMELFEHIISLYTNPDSIFALKKLMKRCGLNEGNCGSRFAYEKALNDFRIYKSCNLPRINSVIPDGITNIKYDVDCSLSEYENIEDIIKYIRECDC